MTGIKSVRNKTSLVNFIYTSPEFIYKSVENIHLMSKLGSSLTI